MHLTMVSMEVIAALCHDSPSVDGELAVQCAWLHDTIEDTATTHEDVAREFGTRVADGVLALSKDSTLAKPLQMGDSLRRIKQQPREVWMVKLADRISNLQPPPAYWTSAKIEAYREEALEIYHSLNEANAFLAERLRMKIDAYRAFVEHT